MLNETANKANHSTLHLFFLLFLDNVCEYLHACLRQLWDDLAYGMIVVVPQISPCITPSAYATASIWPHLGLTPIYTLIAYRRWSLHGIRLNTWLGLDLNGTRRLLYERSINLVSVLFDLDGKHQQTIVKDWNVDQSLLVLRLGCTL